MPPKFKFTKEEIILEAYNLVKEAGIDNLTARSLAQRLNSSSKVIFDSFTNMNELKESVIAFAYDNFLEQIYKGMQNKDKLAYITLGLVYINIAKDNPNIFKLLFMRDTSKEKKPLDNTAREIIAKFISYKSNVSLEDAYEVHDKYWLFMHGIATTSATSYVKLSDEYIEKILKENYESLIRNVKEGVK